MNHHELITAQRYIARAMNEATPSAPVMPPRVRRTPAWKRSCAGALDALAAALQRLSARLDPQRAAGYLARSRPTPV